MVSRTGYRTYRLLTYSTTAAPCVDDEAAAAISALPGPLRIIAVVGCYRSGKTYLLNNFVGLPPEAWLPVSGTTHGCTQGFYVGISEDGHTLILDTEGLNDTQRSHDIITMCCALLLSSCFVFNGGHVIDETAIDSLAVMLEVAARLRVGCTREGQVVEDEDGEQLDALFPRLVWVLRNCDLTLSTVHGSGQQTEATPGEYLEAQLSPTPVPASGPRVARCNARNDIRATIRHCFRRRTLFPIPVPARSTDGEIIAPLFRESCKDLFEHLQNSEDFRLNGHAVSGQVYVAWLRRVAEAATGNTVPIPTLTGAVLVETNTRALRAAMQAYDEGMGTVPLAYDASQRTAPLETEELEELHRNAINAAHREFDALRLGAAQEHSRQLVEEIAASLGRHRQANDQCSHAHNTAVLEALARPLRARVLDGAYFPPTGGFAQFLADTEDLLRQYGQQKRGPTAISDLEAFVREHEHLTEEVRAADTRITAALEEMARINGERLAREAQLEALEADRQRIQQQLQDATATAERQLSALQAEQARSMGELQALIAQREAEAREELARQNKEQAEAVRRLAEESRRVAAEQDAKHARELLEMSQRAAEQQSQLNSTIAGLQSSITELKRPRFPPDDSDDDDDGFCCIL